MEQEQTYTGYAVIVWDRLAGRAWFVGRRGSIDEVCASVDALHRDPLCAGIPIGVHVNRNVVDWAVSDSWNDSSAWSILGDIVAAGEASDVCHGPATYNHADIVLPFHLLDLDASRARSEQLAGSVA